MCVSCVSSIDLHPQAAKEFNPLWTSADAKISEVLVLKARAHVYVSGWVQGVFYRWNAKELAKELRLNGWVRNLPDGRVEAVFEGEKNEVEQIIDWCKNGPPGARVSRVEVTWEDPREESGGFRIVR